MAGPIKTNRSHTPPYKLAALGILVIAAVAFALVYGQFRGDFTPKTKLTMLASRAGLVMDPGSKVTYNGVEIGRVATISETSRDGKPAAKFVLDVYPRYLSLIPANVTADIKATTVFGGKYVSLTTPPNPSSQKLSSQTVIDARSVTTEINTLFQTITSISEKVDPVKLNLTLSAAAQALAGLGDKFGQSIVNGNAILDDVNPQMPQARRDIQQLAALGDTYANAAPDLIDFLNNAVVTSRTINQQQKDLDSALLSAAGFGNTGAEIFEKGGPYLARGAADLVPSAQLLDTYSPAIYCTLRNYHDIEPKAASFLAGNGYSLNAHTESAVRVGPDREPGIGGRHACNPFRRGRRRGRRRAQPLHLSGEPAAGERPRWAGGCARLLAAHHARPMARAGARDGHRQQHRAVQPPGHWVALRDRVRLGAPSRG